MHRKSRPPGGGPDDFGKGRDIMIRKIIHIDEEKCNGCGACATACHEGAIGIMNGKAKLLRDDYCDGFGDCLPACPMDAIHLSSAKRRRMTRRPCRPTSAKAGAERACAHRRLSRQQDAQHPP